VRIYWRVVNTLITLLHVYFALRLRHVSSSPTARCLGLPLNQEWRFAILATSQYLRKIHDLSRATKENKKDSNANTNINNDAAPYTK
jgi:hypothetical protein